MHPLHDRISALLHAHLASKRIVVWYDPRKEFEPYIGELLDGKTTGETLIPVNFKKLKVQVGVYRGSYFALRQQAEPYYAKEEPDLLLLYLPGETWDQKGSPIMELDLAGHRYTGLSLRGEGRHCLKDLGYSDGVIDEMLRADSLGYQDLVRVLAGEGEGQGIGLLRAVFNQSDPESLIAAWLAEPSMDEAVSQKDAGAELLKLVASRVGATLPAEFPKARRMLFRFVLVNEFRSDLQEASIEIPGSIPVAGSKELERVRKVAGLLRKHHAESYRAASDEVEQDLGLSTLGINPDLLGSLDTFRFEERALFGRCAEHVAERRFQVALDLALARQSSFWLTPERRSQWELCARMATLGLAMEAAKAQLHSLKDKPEAWFGWYTEGEQAGHLVDRRFRELETAVATLEEDPEAEPAYSLIRQSYDRFLEESTEGFTRALAKRGWQVPGALHQTRVFEDVVRPLPAKKALILVDALRFEMAVTLKARLEDRVDELKLRPVVAAMPTITPVGMAALMPGAASGFEVVEEGGKLGSKVAGTFLPDLVARKKWLKESVPASVDVDLQTVLTLAPEKLKAQLEGADLVVVRSQEIDASGEGGLGSVARRVMDGLLTTDLVKAMRRLSQAGITHFVLCADHGHHFARAKEDAMKLELPVGQRLEDHRRCVIGRGLQVAAGRVKATGQELGYSSDLEFLFPEGAGVFKCGGDLAFHHGGPSLQELVVPLLTWRTKATDDKATEAVQVRLEGLPDKVTNPIFTVNIECSQGLFAQPLKVYPVLMAQDRVVGEVVTAFDCERDDATQQVTLEPGRRATIVFLLKDESPASIQVKVLDPHTDSDLLKPKTLTVSLTR